MKVLFIANCVPMRGGNCSLLQLMKELMDEPYGIEPVLLTTFDLDRYSSSIVKEAKALGIRCITARFYPFKWQQYRKPASFIKYATNFINYRRILNIVKKEKPDIIHSNSSIIDVGGFLASRLKVKHIWHLREFGDKDFKMMPLLGASQEKRLYRNGDCFIAVSKSVKDRYLPYIPEDKIKVIYNGIPLTAQDTPLPAKPDDGIIRFCISGAVNEAKRQLDAVAAMNVLVNERNIKNVRLIIIGDGFYRERVEKYIHDHDLDGYVEITGWIKNVGDHYATSDVGLMLSTQEGFGRTTVEYMRAGLAVIASDSGANPELIERNVTGLLYPTGDVVALADTMQLLVEDQALRERIAKAGHDFSLRNFHSEDNTRQIFETYMTLTRKTID